MDVYNVRERNIEPIPDACGEIRELYHSDNLSLSKVKIKPYEEGEWHKHNKMEEVYYTIASYGKVLFEKEDEDGNVVDRAEVGINWGGGVIAIPKNVWHKIVNGGSNPLELLVITHPRFNPDDLILREEKEETNP